MRASFPYSSLWDTLAIIIFVIQTSTPPAPSPRRKSVNRNFSLKTWACWVENILNSYPGVWLQIICVCNTIIAETWKCKLQKNANEAFPRLQHFEYFYPCSVSITIGDGKCKMYLHCCTLLHLRVEPVWSLRFEPSSAFALSDRKSNFEVTTKMFICCVPHYWLTGPHPCLHLHPL